MDKEIKETQHKFSMSFMSGIFCAYTLLIGVWRQLIFRQRQVSFFTFSSALLKEVKCPPRRESEILPRLDYSLSVSDPSSVPVTFTLLVGPLFCNLLYTDIQMPLLISSGEFEYQFDWTKLAIKLNFHPKYNNTFLTSF